MCNRRYSRHSPEQFLMLSGLLLLILDGPGFDLEESVVDLEGGLRSKDRTGIDGTRHRALPRLEHLVKLFPRGPVNLAVRIHERAVQLGTQKQRIWRSNVLGDGVKNVQCRKLMVRPGLEVSEITINHLEISSEAEKGNNGCLKSYLGYVFDQHVRDSVSMLGVLLSDDGEVVDGISIVVDQELQRSLVVLGDLVGHLCVGHCDVQGTAEGNANL